MTDSTELCTHVELHEHVQKLKVDIAALRCEFEIVRQASRLFEDAMNVWMERAMKAEAANATDK